MRAEKTAGNRKRTDWRLWQLVGRRRTVHSLEQKHFNAIAKAIVASAAEVEAMIGPKRFEAERKQPLQLVAIAEPNFLEKRQFIVDEEAFASMQ